jgi:hypothetical protein
MKKLLLFLVAIGYSASLIAQQDKRLKGIEVELNKILETTKAAGFAVAIVEGDKSMPKDLGIEIMKTRFRLMRILCLLLAQLPKRLLRLS